MTSTLKDAFESYENTLKTSLRDAQLPILNSALEGATSSLELFAFASQAPSFFWTATAFQQWLTKMDELFQKDENAPEMLLLGGYTYTPAFNDGDPCLPVCSFIEDPDQISHLFSDFWEAKEDELGSLEMDAWMENIHTVYTSYRKDNNFCFGGDGFDPDFFEAVSAALERQEKPDTRWASSNGVAMFFRKGEAPLSTHYMEEGGY